MCTDCEPLYQSFISYVRLIGIKKKKENRFLIQNLKRRRKNKMGNNHGISLITEHLLIYVLVFSKYYS